MAFNRKSGGTNVALTTVKRRSGASWVNVQTVKRRLSGAWVTVWSAYVAMSASAGNVSDTRAHTTGTLVVGSSTCTVTGGNTKTFAWTLISGDGAYTVSGVNTATAMFSHSATVAGTYAATYRCTVTDGTGSTFVNITVTFNVT